MLNRYNCSEKEIFAEMFIKGKPVHFQVDCGASTNLLPKKFADEFEIEKTSTILEMWNKQEVVPVGVARVMVYNPATKKSCKMRFIVVEDGFTPLIGSAASQLSL